MNMKAIAAVLLLAASVPVHAGQGAWLGLALGETDLDVSVDDLDDGSFVMGTADSKDTSFRLSGGYDFNANAGIEVSYADLGEGSVTAVSNGSGPDWFAGAVNATLSGTAFNFGLNGYLPFSDRARGVAKLGISLWDADITASNGGVSVSVSDDGSDPYLAFGVEGDIASNVSAGLSYVRYDFDDADVNSIEIGVKFRLAK